jgi:hypothetical protein
MRKNLTMLTQNTTTVMVFRSLKLIIIVKTATLPTGVITTKMKIKQANIPQFPGPSITFSPNLGGYERNSEQDLQRSLPKGKDQRHESNPMGQAPKISFEKGIIKVLTGYVQDVVAHDLEKEVDERIKEPLGSINDRQRQGKRVSGRNRGRGREIDSGRFSGQGHGKGRENNSIAKDPQVELQQAQILSDATIAVQQRWREVRV